MDDTKNPSVSRNRESLNPEQVQAMTTIEKGYNTFVTGPAGTGKSHFCQVMCDWFQETNRPYVVLAPTGVAAVNVRGQTIHRFFKLRPEIVTFDDYLHDTNGHNWKRKQSAATGMALRTLRVVVIDEISMVTPALFELIDAISQYHRVSKKPFGGLQVILLGDFFQLTPILDKKDRLRQDVAEFVFETPVWKQLDLRTHILKKIMRQDSPHFIHALNDLRVGNYSPRLSQLIQNCTQNAFEPDKHYIQLYALNVQKQDANEIELAKLQTQTVTFTAKDVGNVKYLQNCQAAAAITLKCECPVMLLWNLPNCDLYNGSIGRVTSFIYSIEPKGVFPMVRFNNGVELLIEPQTWTIYDTSVPRTPNSESSVGYPLLAKRTQIPLAVAYSLTTHKTQGLTLDHVMVDASRFFTFGQLYVALSRARDDTKLVIRNFDKTLIRVHPKVLQWSGGDDMQSLSENGDETMDEKEGT